MAIGTLPRMTTKWIRDMRVDALVDVVTPARTAREMLHNLPDGTLEPHMDWLVPNYLDPASGKLILAYQSFVIQYLDRVILVDCAVGEDGEFPARPDWHHRKSNWLNHLGLAGLTPEKIDTVFLTHLHMDHTGWLTRRNGDRWEPSFPHAKHFVSPLELDYWQTHHRGFPFMAASVPDCISPVQEAQLFCPIEAEQELAPDLFVVNLAGHSPGMLGLELRDGERVIAAFNADMMHHPLQMANPDLATLFCHNPEQAIATRRKKLKQYATDRTLMFCGHFPGQSVGLAEASGHGYQFVPIR